MQAKRQFLNLVSGVAVQSSSEAALRNMRYSPTNQRLQTENPSTRTQEIWAELQFRSAGNHHPAAQFVATAVQRQSSAWYLPKGRAVPPPRTEPNPPLISHDSGKQL